MLPAQQAQLEQRMAAWASTRGLALSQVRIASLRPIPMASAAAMAAMSTNQERSPAAVTRGFNPTGFEAALLLHGIEIVVELALPAAGGGSPSNGDGSKSARAPPASQLGLGMDMVVTARTDCAWPAARRRVAIAAEKSLGGRLEGLLDALFCVWREDEAAEQAAASAPTAAEAARASRPSDASRSETEAEEEAKGKGQSSLSAIQEAYKKERRQLAENFRANTSHLRDGELDVVSEDRRSSSSSGAAAVPEQEGVHLRAERDSSLSSGGEPSTSRSEGAEHDGDPARGAQGSFGSWLSERPPLWRFDNMAAGMGWDFPLTKAEKRELLLLQLFAEERVRDAEIRALHRESRGPGSHASARR